MTAAVAACLATLRERLPTRNARSRLVNQETCDAYSSTNALPIRATRPRRSLPDTGPPGPTFASLEGQFYDRAPFDNLARQVHALYEPGDADVFRTRLDRRLRDRHSAPVDWTVQPAAYRGSTARRVSAPPQRRALPALVRTLRENGRLLAALARRCETDRLAPPVAGPTFREPADIAAYLGPEMADLPQEQLRVVLLDRRGRLIDTPLIYQGGQTETAVRLADCFREAVRPTPRR